jgi:hypothetical protein
MSRVLDGYQANFFEKPHLGSLGVTALTVAVRLKEP